jgi:hypothetical protein
MKNADKMINKIKSDQIQPLPRSRFLLRKALVWFAYSAFLIVGAISFSIILYAIQQSSFDLLEHIDDSGLEFFLVLFPIVWLITLIFFLLASIWTVKNSKKGYKWSSGKWLGYTTTLSLVIGTLFFISGGAQWFEKSFANQVEVYQSIEERKIKVWSNPEKGNLSGEIKDLNKDTIYITDFSSHRWKILTGEAFVAPMVILEEGERIKINGEMIDDKTFRASDIRPWGRKNFDNFKKSERKGNGPRNRK